MLTLTADEIAILRVLHRFEFDGWPHADGGTGRSISPVPIYAIEGALWPADAASIDRALRRLVRCGLATADDCGNVACRLRRDDGTELRLHFPHIMNGDKPGTRDNAHFTVLDKAGKVLSGWRCLTTLITLPTGDGGTPSSTTIAQYEIDKNGRPVLIGRPTRGYALTAAGIAAVQSVAAETAAAGNAAARIAGAADARPAAAVAPRKTSARRGRPRDTDPALDEKWYQLWKTGRFRTYADCGHELGVDGRAVNLAVDRHEKRQRTRGND